jgi:hypothetical protein
MRVRIHLATMSVIASPALAGNLDLKVEIPRKDVAEYHRPYVAVWLERPGEGVVSTLAVWYEVQSDDHEGEKYLKELRQWWRRIGRELKVPIDGVTGATRAPGQHQLTFVEQKAPLSKLAPGKYQLVVEAVRESGGRELVRIPFDWPATAATPLTASGENELAGITLVVRP